MLAAAAARLGQLAGQLVWWVFIVIRWAHANFVARPCDFFLDSVLGSWEEAVRVSVRESFAWMARAINGLSAQAVSLFVDPNYYDSMRAGRRRPTAWQRWWAERAHRGTFNAVVERDGLVARSRASPSPTPSPGPPIWTPRGSLARVFGSSERLLYEQQQRQTEILLAAERLHAAGGILALPRRRRRWLGFLRWPFGKWRAAGSSSHGNSHEKLGSSPGLSPPRMRRSGSELFDRPSGYAMAEGMQRRGLLEEGRIALELAVTIVFDAVRTSVRALLLLRKRPKWEPAGGYHGSSWFSDWTGGERRATRGRARQRSLRAARTRSFGVLEDLQVWTVSDCILQAGYPLEEHVVTTEDGCILHMQRIPRKGSRDTVFFQHGVLDTSLGWVSNGIQGSQAFAAWDQGHDVWLGNARSNPPRMHANPRLGGSRYWNYSLNELGTQDIAAQIAQIHAVKMRELRPGSGYGQAGGAMERAASLGAPAGLRRSYSDSAVSAMHLLRPSPFGEPEAEASEAARPASPGAGAHHQQQQQQQQQGEPSPSGRRNSASLDGGPDVESFRRRMRRLGLRVQLPSAAGEEPRRPAGPSTARAAGEKAWRQSGRHAGPAPAQARQQQQQPASDSPGAGGVQAPASTEGNQWFDAAEEPAQPAEFGKPSCSSDGVDDGGSPGSAFRASNSLDLGLDGSSSSSQLGPGPPAPGIPVPSRQPSAAASSQRIAPPLRSLSSLPGSAVAAAVTPPALTPRLPAAERQALTPDKFAVSGVEQPGEAEAASTPLLLPTPSASNWSAATPRLPAAVPVAAGCGTEPYRLRAVGHSLGGASLLIYAVYCGLAGRPHHLRRMVLLTPAGYHANYPSAAFPFVYLVPLLMAGLSWVLPGVGAPVYIPSSLLRYIAFKFSHDLQQIPGLNELIRAALRLMLNGDKSEWDRALQMPHYNTYGMPAISLHTGAHLIQLIRTRRFLMYNYGSAAANRAAYGQDTPLDVAASYGLLQGLPVDLVAGGSDGIIAEVDVHSHYEAMRAAGVQVTFKRFQNVGHLDVTFGMKEEIRRYVISRLLLP